MAGAVFALLIVSGVGCAKQTPTRVFGAQVSREDPSTRGRLHGVVHDADGRPHGNAHLTLEGLGVHLVAVADAAGAYEFTGLVPGTYVLTTLSSDNTSPTSGKVYLGPTERSTRKEVVVQLGDNLVDAESGF